MTTAVQLAQSVAPGVSLGFKNRLINGQMQIDQRNAGASVTSGYPVDRFFTQYGAGTLTFQQTTSIVPAGFSSALGITVTSAGTRNAGDYYGLFQIIEGYNVADFNEGTSNAKTFTVSFWIRSSVSGLYSGAVRSGDNNRSYVFTYTVDSANTWQYVTATVVGDTGGSTSNWPTNSSQGLRLCFDLGSGSDYQQTAGSWQANANKFGASGTVGWAQTAGATFYITGVQLEKGSTATSFDYRPYGTEFQLCQRYYQLITTGPYRRYVANVDRDPKTIAVAMRTIPTLSITISGATNLNLDSSSATSQSSWSLDLQYTSGGSGVIDIANFTAYASSEL